MTTTILSKTEIAYMHSGKVRDVNGIKTVKYINCAHLTVSRDDATHKSITVISAYGKNFELITNLTRKLHMPRGTRAYLTQQTPVINHQYIYEIFLIDTKTGNFESFPTNRALFDESAPGIQNSVTHARDMMAAHNHKTYIRSLTQNQKNVLPTDLIKTYTDSYDGTINKFRSIYGQLKQKSK